MWRRHPLHVIVGLDLVLIGLILLTHYHYFFWPPRPAWMLTTVENNVLIGSIGVVIGVGMIYWAISKEKSIKLNRMLIPTGSAYFTFLAVTEFLHGLFSPLGTPHMYTSGLSELIMVLITLYMARNSPTEHEG